jgi:NADPH:quinone reductase-like Zn-dependent oxidoreductase
MKAIVQDRYGLPEEVLILREVEKPNPKDDEVLIRVRASSVNPDVWHGIVGTPYILRLTGIGYRRPKNPIPGLDVAGTVESVGKNVTRFACGDDVFGEVPRGKINWGNCGSFADYVCVAAENLALKPTNITFEQASAAATSGYIALLTLRMFFEIHAHHKVLINGAGGGVGSIVLQLAKAKGAHVTAVDNHKKLDMLRSLGADEVIDYSRQDIFAKNERYELIVDVASNLTLAECRKRALTPSGIYLVIGHDNYGAGGKIVGPAIPRALGYAARSLFDSRMPKIKFPIPSKGEVMESVRGLLAARTLTPFIDKTYPLGSAVEALRYMREGHARGRVVIVP